MSQRLSVPCCAVLLSVLQVRLPAQRPVKAVREPMDQFCGEANADTVYKGECMRSGVL
jgi:hypothetical protein